MSEKNPSVLKTPALKKGATTRSQSKSRLNSNVATAIANSGDEKTKNVRREQTHNSPLSVDSSSDESEINTLTVSSVEQRPASLLKRLSDNLLNAISFAGHSHASSSQESLSADENKVQQLDTTPPSSPTASISRASSSSSISSDDDMTSHWQLTRNNFETWFTRIEALLIDKELWIDLDVDVAGMDEGTKSKARRAYAKIVKFCDDDNVTFIRQHGGSNSVTTLNKLIERHEGDGPMSEIQLLIESLTMRWTPGNNSNPIEKHIDALRQRYNTLERKGVAFPKTLPVANLMISVGTEFGSIFSTFISGDKANLTYDKVSKALLTEQCRQKVVNGSSSASASVDPQSSFANKPLKSKSAQTRDKRKAKGMCSHCKKPGHTADTCYAKHGKPPAKKDVSKPKAHSASHHCDYPSDEDAGNHSSTYACAYTAFVNNEGINHQQQSSSLLKDVIANPRKDDLRKFISAKRRLNSLAVIPTHSTLGRASGYHVKHEMTATASKPQQRRSTTPPLEDWMLSPFSGAKRQRNEQSLEADVDNTSPAASDALSLDLSETESNKILETYSLSCNTSSPEKISGFIVDSGASISMAHDRALFDFIKRAAGNITIANGRQIPIIGRGDITLSVSTETTPTTLKLHNVAYAPDLHVNLISVNELNRAGHTIIFENSSCKIKVGKQFVTFANFHGSNFKVLEESSNVALPCIHTWHRRLAHRNLRDIKNLRTHGLKFSKCCCTDECDACIRGKSSEKPFKAETIVTAPLEVISTDICGPIRTRSLGGANYFLTLTDAFTDYTTVKFLKQKSDAVQEIKNFVAFLKLQLSTTMKTIRSDCGGEFCNVELKTFLDKEGIRHELTTPHSSQSNGRAERKNRTINDTVRTLLIASELPDYLWAEAANNAVYTQNRIIRPGRSATPIELFFQKKARSTFVEFGAPVYVNTVKPGRGKLDPHATTMKFLSVDDHSKGFRVWDGKRVIISRNVKPKLNAAVMEYKNPLTSLSLNEEDHESHIDCDPTPQQTHNEHNSVFHNEPILRRSTRLKDKAQASAVMHIPAGEEPRTYKQAIASPDASRWLEAMQEELLSLQHTKTYEVTDLPTDRTAIGCKWVYKIKSSDVGEVKYKARLVAKGYSQKYGQDYCEIFAPVVRPQAIRLLLSMAGKLKLHVNQFDVKTAFLNGTLTEELYMKQPEGFEVGNKVWRLRKSLYGLKQAARSWNQLLKTAITSCGYIQSEADECLFVKRTERDISMIAAHVDDFILSSSSQQIINDTARRLQNYFELKNLGPVKRFLGVDITRHSDGHFSISQRQYIEKIAKELKLDGCNMQKFPLDPGYYKLEDEKLLNSNETYRQVIGMLLYVSTNTRPDISASVCILAQRVIEPRALDMAEALRTVKYLIGTKDHELHLNNPASQQSLIMFSDANFGECRLNGKSNSGMICFINGGPISWSSRKQSYVALSTCEAEFYAISEAVKETLWLRKLLAEFTGPITSPTKLYNDNMASISMITNGNFMQRTKYVGVRGHYIADWIKRDVIDLDHCATEYNTADLLTKPLNSVRIATLRTSAGLLPSNAQPSASNTTPVMSH